MAETPSSHEYVPPQPPQGGAGADDTRPGYPPAGSAEARDIRLAAEAADREGEDPEAVLATLEAGAETPSERTDRLGEFVELHLAEVCPPEYRATGIARCQNFEDQYRELFEEPDLQLGEEDAADPDLRREVENAAITAANDEAIAVRTGEAEDRETAIATNDADVIPASQTRRAELEAAHPNIDVPATEAERASALAAETARTNRLHDRDMATSAETAGELQQEEGIAEDLDSVRELQANFNELKAEHGTIGALQMLLEGENAVQSPEMRTIVQRAISTARALVSALPGREADISRLLDQSGLNLGAASQAEVFASLFSAAEASDEFSDEDVEQLC